MSLINEKEQEERLKALGLSEVRVTPEMLDSMIKEKTFLLHPCKTVMTCTITLHNGFKLFGINTTVDPANFKLELAEEYSFNDARNQMWPYAGFLLAEDNYRGNAPLTQEQRGLPEHVQLVMREFLQLNSRLASLTNVLDSFREMTPEQITETGVAPEEVMDLKAQQVQMGKLAAILQRRLQRAGF